MSKRYVYVFTVTLAANTNKSRRQALQMILVVCCLLLLFDSDDKGQWTSSGSNNGLRWGPPARHLPFRYQSRVASSSDVGSFNPQIPNPKSQFQAPEPP